MNRPANPYFTITVGECFGERLCRADQDRPGMAERELDEPRAELLEQPIRHDGVGVSLSFQ
jgi:hypothetical protein